MEEKPSGSDNEGLPDSSNCSRDTSALDVSSKMDSSSVDADASLVQESSVVMQTPDTSTLVSSSQQMSPQDETPTVTSPETTAIKIIEEDSQPAASVTEPTAEFQEPASDNMAGNTAVQSAGTSMTTAPGKMTNENTDDTVDKLNVSEERPGKDDTTTSAPVVNKT